MQNFIHNKTILIPATIGLSLLFSGAVFANDDLRNGIVSVQNITATITQVISDELVNTDFEDFNFDLKIVRIESTEKDVRIVYQFETMIKTNDVWSQNKNEEVLIVKNERIEDEDQLKAFVNNELLEVVEQERMYLKRLQEREQEALEALENDNRDIVEVSVLNGLFELTFDAPIESEEKEVSQENDERGKAEEEELVPLAGISRSLPLEDATEILIEPGRLGNGDETYTLDEWIEDLENAETEEEIDEVLETDPENLPSDFEDQDEQEGGETATTTESDDQQEEDTTANSTDEDPVENTTSTSTPTDQSSATSTQEVDGGQEENATTTESNTESEENTISATSTLIEDRDTEETQEEEQPQGNIIVTTGESEDEELVVITETPEVNEETQEEPESASAESQEGSTEGNVSQESEDQEESDDTEDETVEINEV